MNFRPSRNVMVSTPYGCVEVRIYEVPTTIVEIEPMARACHQWLIDNVFADQHPDYVMPLPTLGVNRAGIFFSFRFNDVRSGDQLADDSAKRKLVTALNKIPGVKMANS